MSNMGYLSINFVRLAETTAHIQSAIGALQMQLDHLEKDAAPLVQTWTGDSQVAYQERQATWRRTSTELISMLQGIQRALDHSVDDYKGTERSNVGLFRH